ncbi:MAG: sortase [Clostridiaceae bacterium]|nr:sortase [Clostridiaceae bacterium]
MHKIRPNPIFEQDGEKPVDSADKDNLDATEKNSTESSDSQNSSNSQETSDLQNSTNLASKQMKKREKKQKKKKRPIIIILDILIIGCFLGAAYFLLEPKLRSKRQSAIEQSAIAEIDAVLELSNTNTETNDIPENEPVTPSITITVNPDANKVPGEGYEDFGQGERIEVDAPVLDQYGNVIINFIGTLKIPKIDLTTPIADNDSLIALRYGAGHTAESAKIGQPGRALIFGHWFDEYGRVFNRLNEIEVGDEFTIDLLETKTRYHYVVHEMLEIDNSLLYEYLFEREPKVDNEVVLVSCKVENRMWWSTTGRYLAHGKLIKSEYLGSPKKNPLKHYIE